MTEECFDFPRRVLLLTVPGGFYWSVPRESWCSFPLVFLHREQWSELRLCSVTTETGGVDFVFASHGVAVFVKRGRV